MYQKLAGKLQHASYGIPGGKGLFRPIQQAVQGNPEFINITTELKQILGDWRYFIKYMARNPTSVFQLVSEYPDYIGYVDACKLGTGGIWTSGLKPLHPTFWQVEWPGDIQDHLIRDENPKGDITINDLELSGQVLHWMVLEHLQVPLRHTHIVIFCDNTSAVVWAHKLRTSESKISGRLLRFLGLRIHAAEDSHLLPMHIPGE